MIIFQKPRHNLKSKGFTLIELALVIMVMAILVNVAVPTFQDNIAKARLVDLQLRIDAMRTAMASAYESGERSMFSMGAGSIGQVPDTINRVPLNDSMVYPGLMLMLMSSDKQFRQFSAETRPYLVIAAAGPDGPRLLKNFSEIYPAQNWAWWVPSTIMVVPLLDLSQISNSQTPPTQTQPTQTQTVQTPPTQTQTVQTPPTQTQTVQTPTTQTQTVQTQTTTTLPANTNLGNGNPPFLNQKPNCVHPGNGHAFGRCRN